MHPIVDSLPPNSPEAERGVLGCCLLDISKAAAAVKAGVTRRWFYEGRHAELFHVLAAMAADGGGDALLATMTLRERGKLEAVGGLAYLQELQNAVPSAENLDYYIPELLNYSRRRQVLDAATRLKRLAEDPTADSAVVLSDTEGLLETLRRRAERNALPEIVTATDFLATDLATPRELVSGLLHQGSKLIVGGSSKSYKTWTLTDLAVSVATGTPWLGFETTAGKVLYVNLEIQPAFFRGRIANIVEAKHVEVNERLEVWNLRGCVADYRSLIPKIRTRIQDERHALVIVDPTYKMLGEADENSATDITALLGAIENLAVTTGAAVAMAGHFAKGNAAAKETIDRISGSGVFARDPDSLITFTKHEEEGAFAVEMVLRNLPPVKPFVVTWEWPLFRRAESLDPTRLKQAGGRPAKHKAEELLGQLNGNRLKTSEWSKLAKTELGIPNGSFFALLKQLEAAEKVRKSSIDDKWELLQNNSKTSNPYNDQ